VLGLVIIMPPLIKSLSYSTYCEPIFREGTRKLALVKGDVAEALRQYKEKKGHLPPKVCLYPDNVFLQQEVPEGIEVEFRQGLCLWEVWLENGERKVEEKSEEPKTGPPEPLEILPDALTSKSDGILPQVSKSLPPLLSHNSVKHPKRSKKVKDNATPIISQKSVSKILKKEKHKKIKVPGIRGRPLKLGEVSRATKYRRAKKLKAQQEKML
jgi:hypothetical protein